MSRLPAIAISAACVIASIAGTVVLIVGMGWISPDAVTGAVDAASQDAGLYFSLMFHLASGEWPHYVFTLLASLFLAGIIYKVLRQNNAN